MKTIMQILANKKKGIDCTEEESAELKGFLKEEKTSKFPLYPEVFNDVAYFFPLEYSEAMDELEKVNQ